MPGLEIVFPFKDLAFQTVLFPTRPVARCKAGQQQGYRALDTTKRFAFKGTGPDVRRAGI